MSQGTIDTHASLSMTILKAIESVPTNVAIWIAAIIAPIINLLLSLFVEGRKSRLLVDSRLREHRALRGEEKQFEVMKEAYTRLVEYHNTLKSYADAKSNFDFDNCKANACLKGNDLESYVVYNAVFLPSDIVDDLLEPWLSIKPLFVHNLPRLPEDMMTEVLEYRSAETKKVLKKIRAVILG